MPRGTKKKTQRHKVSVDVMTEAAKLVLEHGFSLRQAARIFQIPCHVTLYRFAKKLKQGLPATLGYNPFKKVFSAEQEEMIVQYLINAENHNIGFGPKGIRKVAFQLAIKYGLDRPAKWNSKKMAGKSWFTNFTKRNPSLPVRISQTTRLAKATAFNRLTVTTFFGKLKELFEKYKFKSNEIWNFDEIGVSVVHKAQKVFVSKNRIELHQVGTVVPKAEIGTLISLGLAVNAAGNSLPPVTVFPCTKDDLVMESPDYAGIKNDSGWMRDEDFLVYMKYFVGCVKPSKEHPVLLTFDNHSFHVDVTVLDYCRENHVILFQFPRHCSHKLQPIERSGVFSSFKHYLRKEHAKWVKENPGKTISIYDLSLLISRTLPKAANPAKIMSGFQVSGIAPFNPDVFIDLDYSRSDVITNNLMTSSLDGPKIPPINTEDQQQCYLREPTTIYAEIPNGENSGLICKFLSINITGDANDETNINVNLPPTTNPNLAHQYLFNFWGWSSNSYFNQTPQLVLPVFDPELMFPDSLY